MDWELKGKQVFEDFFEGKWKFQKDSLQGVNVDKLKQVFKSGQEKDVYKLVLKNEWKSDEKIDFEKGVRGALGLVKATWKGKSGGENGWEVENIEVNENQKVWLIMAQGAEAIYLMPVVRTSGWWGGSSDSYCWVTAGDTNAKGEVERSGVSEIKTWSFDNVKEWKDYQDKRIQNAMTSGFSITRKAEGAVMSWKEGERNWLVYGTDEGSWKNNEGNGAGGKNEYLYKNAGVLNLTGIASEAKSCYEVEHYFPLDLVILNNLATKRGLSK